MISGGSVQTVLTAVPAKTPQVSQPTSDKISRNQPVPLLRASIGRTTASARTDGERVNNNTPKKESVMDVTVLQAQLVNELDRCLTIITDSKVSAELREATARRYASMKKVLWELPDTEIEAVAAEVMARGHATV